MNNLIANDEMLTVKGDLDNLYSQLTENINLITSNINVVKTNWKGIKSKTTLKDFDDIEKSNTDILKRIEEKSKQLLKAYETYHAAQDTNIVQAEASPTVEQTGSTDDSVVVASSNEDSQGQSDVPIDESVVVASSDEDSQSESDVSIDDSVVVESSSDSSLAQTVVSTDEGVVVVSSDEALQNLKISVTPGTSGTLISPNVESLDFIKNPDGSYKKHGDTDFYPAKIVVNGTTVNYLVYLAGRAPGEPIPQGLPILMTLHGSGEARMDNKTSYSYSEANKSIKNAFGSYGSDLNGNEVVAIMPQIVNKKFYRDDTMETLHVIYEDVKNAYGTQDKMDLSGLSMGGQTVIKYASQYPNDISVATVMAAGPPEDGSLRLTEESYENLRKVNMIFVCGDNDKQYPRTVKLLNTLTGNNVSTLTVSKNGSVEGIITTHSSEGGIQHVTITGAGHNTWTMAYPSIISKYK